MFLYGLEDNTNMSSKCCLYLSQKLHIKVLGKARLNEEPLTAPYT